MSLKQKQMKTFPKTIKKMEDYITKKFPSFSEIVEQVNITKGKDNYISPYQKQNIKAVDFTSKRCSVEANPTESVEYGFKMAACDSLDEYRDKAIKKAMSLGKSFKQAKEQLSNVIRNSRYIGFDPKTKQNIITAKPVGVKDSVLEQMGILPFDIGWASKVFRQPLVKSYAKKLVSVESFSNPFASYVGVLTSAFEGMGNISEVARSNFERNASNPISAQIGSIIDDIVHISIDYENNELQEHQANKNPYHAQIMAQKLSYAQQILDTMQNAMILYGNKECMVNGLVDVAPVVDWDGDTMQQIFRSNDTTKGAKIIKAFNIVFGDFIKDTHYMAKKVDICCSEDVFQAMSQTIMSDEFNPNSPLKVFMENFNIHMKFMQGEQELAHVEFHADPFCNASKDGEENPFNPLGKDYMFMTISELEDAQGTQSGLVIHPELFNNLTVPALFQRQGTLYTSYKAIGGVIAPLGKNTVHVVRGFGYRE